MLRYLALSLLIVLAAPQAVLAQAGGVPVRVTTPVQTGNVTKGVTDSVNARETAEREAAAKAAEAKAQAEKDAAAKVNQGAPPAAGR